MKPQLTLKGRQAGFTMVELLITMTIFILTIVAATSIFVPLLTQFKQQSRITETQTEGLVGLDILRRDIEMAGFGLPYSIPAGVNYQEASSATPSNYNDNADNPPIPRAIRSGNNVAFADIVAGSDYLVIKATSIATNDAATKWTDVMTVSGGARRVRQWGNPAPSALEDLNNGDRVIVLDPAMGKRTLKKNDDNNAFYTQFNPAVFPVEFSPANAGEVFLVYGVDPDTSLRMPFNRADYFVSTTSVPARCAQNTGVLRKSVISQGDGSFRGGGFALLDCVADMQVFYRRDTDNDGVFDNDTQDLTGLSAQEIRDTVKQVSLYILAHEGQRDTTFTFNSFTPGACATCIRVGEPINGPWALQWGRDFNLATIPNYQDYRWKVYTIVVKPKNLR